MAIDVPLFKAVVCKNGSKGYMLCSYEHALKHRADGSKYYTQVNRKKIADIAGGQKSGLVVFSEDFLNKNPELRKYRVYRDGPSNIYEKIDLEEGEAPVVCTVRNARGMQPRGMVQSDVAGIPKVTHELVRDSNNNLVLKEFSSDDVSSSTVSETSNDVASESARSSSDDASHSSESARPSYDSSIIFPRRARKGHNGNDKKSSYESHDGVCRKIQITNGIWDARSYVINQIFEDLDFADSLSEAGLDQGAINKLRAITSQMFTEQKNNEKDDWLYTKDVKKTKARCNKAQDSCQNEAPDSSIEESLTFDVVDKFFDINLSKRLDEYGEGSSILNVISDGHSTATKDNLLAEEAELCEDGGRDGGQDDGGPLSRLNFGLISNAWKMCPIYVDLISDKANDLTIFQNLARKVANCSKNKAQITEVANYDPYSSSNVDDLLQHGVDLVINHSKVGSANQIDECKNAVNFTAIKSIILSTLVDHELDFSACRSFGSKDYLGYKLIFLDHQDESYPVLSKNDSKSQRSDLYMHIFYNVISCRERESLASSNAIAALRSLYHDKELTAENLDDLKHYTDYEEKLALGQVRKTALDTKRMRESAYIDECAVFMTSRNKTDDEMYTVYQLLRPMDFCKSVISDCLNVHLNGSTSDEGVLTTRLCGFMATAIRCELFNRLTEYKENNSSIRHSNDIFSVGSLLETIASIHIIRSGEDISLRGHGMLLPIKRWEVFKAIGVMQPDTYS